MTEKKKLSEKTENEMKKEYLKSYCESVRACKRIEEQLRELELLHTCPGTKMITDMPKGSTVLSDLSDYIVAVEKLKAEMIAERYKRIVIYTDVFKAIEALDDETERSILTYRYIKKMSWEKIACEVHLEWAQLHRIHARALKKIELPKNMIHNDTGTSATMIA